MKTLGIDEVGYGAQAGPLVVAGVILKEDIEGLKDSKQLKPEERERLSKLIKKKSDYLIVEVSVKTINELGVRRAVREGVISILKQMKGYEHIIVDGMSLDIPDFDIIYLPHADQSIPEVSAASIIAKVYRDELMTLLSAKYPEYGWDSNKGYLTKKHLEAIAKYGTCELHRKYITKEKAERLIDSSPNATR